jgi:cytochrome c-type biogenesis protein CcmF
MAVGPLLPWRAAGGELLRKRLLVPAWCGGITLVVSLLLGATGVAQVLAFSLAAFALASIARTIVIGVRARRRAHHESLPTAAVRMVRGNTRLYGGLTVHIGVVVIAVALAASQGYTTRHDVQLSPGQSATVRGYTVTYLGPDIHRSPQKTTVEARVRLARGRDVLGVYAPAISTFPNFTSGIGTPSVRPGLLRDVYLTLVSSPTQTGRVGIRVQINPMVVWLWVGGLIMALGTALALVPNRRRRIVPAPETAALSDAEPPELVEAAT